MQILVLGAGAIGSVFGGLLAKAGHRVMLVGRAAHMEAVRAQGLSIGGLWGEQLITNLETATGVAQFPSDSIDVVLLTTKSYDTASAIQEALPVVGPETLVVSLQNGLGNLEVIEAAVGVERTVAARVIFGVDVERPGRVVVTVWGGDVLLGSQRGEEPTPRMRELAEVLTTAGIKSQATPQVFAYIWGKVLYNVALNPLSGLLSVPYGALAEHESTRRLMELMIAEGFAVGRAAGAPLLWETPEAFARVLYEQLLPPTAKHYSSMYADLQHGKRTEIDAMNGALVRLGQEHGVPTPVNESISLLIKAREGLNG